MSPKHTPGPWSMHLGGESEYLIKGDGWVIATTDKPHASMNSSEEANARLIASAPDMLEALLKLQAIYNDHGRTYYDLAEIRDIIQKGLGQK